MQNSVVCCAWGYAVILVMACFRFIVKCACVRVLMETVRTMSELVAPLFSQQVHHIQFSPFRLSLGFHFSQLTSYLNLALYMIDEAKKRRCGWEKRHFVIGAKRNRGEGLHFILMEKE